MSKWEEKRLEDIIDVNPIVKLKKGESYPFIDIDKVSPTRRSVTNEEVKVYNGQSSSKFCNGDTVFSRITPCLENRKIAKVFINGDAAFGSTEFYIFRAKKKKADERFTYYLTSSDAVVLPAINSMTGASGRQRADKKFIQRLKLNLPDLPTQERIADILSAYDDLIEANNRRIELLEHAVQELYKEWFVRFRFPGHERAKFKNGLPEGWTVKKVKQIVERKPFGKLYKASNTSSAGKVIVIDQSKEEYIGFHNEEPAHLASLKNPIILFGDHSCKFQLMTVPFSLSENVIPFIGKENIVTTYLYYLVNGLVRTTEYKRHWAELINKKVLVADFNLQQLFANKIQKNLCLIELLKKNNRNLAAQRDLLLPRLMSGKLEV